MESAVWLVRTGPLLVVPGGLLVFLGDEVFGVGAHRSGGLGAAGVVAVVLFGAQDQDEVVDRFAVAVAVAVCDDPGFVFAYKSIAPTSDAGSIKLRFDAAQVTYTFSTLSRAAHSTARCVDRCAPFAGAVLPDDFSHLCAEVRDLNAAVEQAVSAESDPAVHAVVARAMRALKAGEPDQFWFRSDDFTPNQLAAIFRILQLPDPGDSQT